MQDAKQKGFTLIEILTVIIIIGILAGVLLPVLTIARYKARSAATSATMAAIEGAAAQFKDEWGVYPPDEFTTANLGANFYIGCLQPELAYSLNGNARNLLRDTQNNTTKGLVHLLGSQFKHLGKQFGPYMRFPAGQLKIPTGEDGTVLEARYTCRAHNSLVEVLGVGPTVGVNGYQVVILADWFGNAYVYDCHDPEGTGRGLMLADPSINAVHNFGRFDMYSFGYKYTKQGRFVTDYDKDLTKVGTNEYAVRNWK